MSSPAISARRRRVVTAALLLGTFLSSIEVMVVSPAMPTVVGELGRAGLYPWVFSAYILAQTATIPLYGAMADRHGRRAAYTLGVTLFLLGSIACALAPSMGALVAARALHGLGSGALVTLTRTLFGDRYPAAERTKMQGVFSLVWGVSALLGPPVGGLVTQSWSWRAIFWANLPLGIIAAAVVAATVPSALGVGGRSPGLLASARDLLRNPAQQVINGAGVLLGVCLIGMIGYLPVWVTAAEGGGPVAAGLAILPMSLAWTAAANVAGRLVGRFGFQTLVRAGVALLTAGAVAVAVWPVTRVGLVVVGAGFGFIISLFTVSSQEAAPLQLRGTATALALYARSLGSALGAPVLGALAGLKPGATSFSDVTGLTAGLGRAFATVALGAAGAAVLTVWRFPKAVRPL